MLSRINRFRKGEKPFFSCVLIFSAVERLLIFLCRFYMLNIFKKKTSIKDIAEAFPVWERGLKVDFYVKFLDWNLSHGLPEEIGRRIAAQGVNYITGEEWEKNLQSATEEIKKTVDKHKSEINPAVKAMLETNKMCREVIVNYLRIKSVLMFATLESEHMESDTKKMIEEILLIYSPEFPEEADPVKFGQLMLDFHHKIFPNK